MDHTHPLSPLSPARLRRSAIVGTTGLAALALVGAPLHATAAAAAADTTSPDTTLHTGTTPASGWFRGDVAARITASDDESGVASISYVIGDGAPVTTSGADVMLTVRGQGVVALTYWATDLAGNEEPTTTRFFSIDTEAPTIDIATPTLVERGAPLAFDYVCGDAASGVASCTSAVAAGAALDTEVLGEHAIEVTATDVAGWTTTRTFRYLVAPDLTAPAVSIAMAPIPASGWYTSGIGVQVVANDASGIASYHWSTSGAVALGGWTDGRESDPVFTIDADGTTEVRVWALDAHGNRADATARARIDTVAPVVTVGGGLPALAAAGPTEFRRGERVVIRAVCDDATSGVADCGILEVPSGVVPTDAVGDHALTLVGTDVAGNRTETSFAYRVLAPVTEPGGGAGGGAGDPRPTPAGGPRELASTGVDTAGTVMLGGLLAGAGLGALGVRRMSRR